MKRITVFDFDGTLTKRDTLVPISFYFAKRGNLFSFLKFFSCYIAFKLKTVSNESLKQQFAISFFKGRDVNETKELLIGYMKHYVRINSGVFEEFLKSIKNDERVMVVSANFDIVIESWLANINVDKVEIIATELECQNGFYTGEILGDICRGMVKADRLRKVIKVNDCFLTSYADEKSDEAIMSLADKRYWV